MIQQTSLEAYKKIYPKLSRKRTEILTVFLGNQFCNFTNQEVLRELGWRCISSVTPRVFELRKYGFLEHYVTRECNVTHNTAMAWGLSKKGYSLLQKIR